MVSKDLERIHFGCVFQSVAGLEDDGILWSYSVVGLELWYTAILVRLAVYLSNASISISIFSIWQDTLEALVRSVNIVVFVFIIYLGFQASISMRVSNELGAENAEATDFSVKVNLVTSITVGVIFSILSLSFIKQIVRMFTNYEEVASKVCCLSGLLALMILGWRMAVWVNFVSFYMVRIPLGVVLVYVALWQVKRMWIGLLIGLTMQTVVLAVIVWRTNWEEQVAIAYECVNR